MLGAEKGGVAHLAGGVVDGWDAPAIAAAAGWSRQALFDYLRSGHSTDHGSAGGPMAEVVASLSALPDSDIAAMADYLAGKNPVSEEAAAARKSTLVEEAEAARQEATILYPEGARLFSGACSSCHEAGSPLASLALSSKLSAARPDNLLRTIFEGAQAPAAVRARALASGPAVAASATASEAFDVMSMPGFSGSMSDRQVAELAAYLRARFASQQAGWSGLSEAAARARGLD